MESSTSRLTRTIFSHAALMTLSFIFLVPFAWLLTTSLKSESHMSKFPPEWLPKGEYVRMDDGSEREVVRQEVLEYEDLVYDAEGKPLPRRPKVVKVNLVDWTGRPLQEQIFSIAMHYADELDRTGRLSPRLLEEFSRRGIALDPAIPVIDAEHGRPGWRIDAGETRYLLDPGRENIAVFSTKPSVQVVDAARIETRTRPTLRHYALGIRAFDFDLFLQNTLFICIIAVGGTVLSCSWVAFGFSVLQWRGRDAVFYLMLSTMMLPGQVTMIPLFLIFRWLGWVDTYLPLLVPAFLGNAFFIFLLRQFFLTIPRDLIDAARVDGCGTFRIYWQIVIPLSIPALATVALFTFMGSWNDFMGPLVYIVDEAKYTLSLGLAMFKGRFQTRYGEMMAVSVLLTLPIIVLFFFTQKTFIQGIKTTGMKN